MKETNRVIHYLNVCDMNGSKIKPVDVITFGSPCQDMSVAGKREGLKHSEQGDEETTRSGLFYEAIRIIKEMREATNGEYPKYAVWENVPGAFSSNKGWDFHAVLEALCSVCDDAVSIPKPYDTKRTKLVWNKAGEIVGDNYSVAWRTLDAQYWGVPQRRKRIYLVADFTGRRAGEILFKPDSLRGDMPQGDEAWQGATADAVGSVDGSVGAAGVVSKGNGECFIMPERHMSLSVGGGQAGQGYPCTVYSFDSLSSNSMKSSNPISGCRAVDVAKCIDTTYPDPSKNQGGVAVVECIGYDMYNQASTGDKTRTLKTPAGGDDLPVVCVLNDQGGSSINVESEETSPTLRANSHQHEPVIALQANGIDRADTAGCNGAGWRENESYTLNTVDRHAVCFEPGAMVRDMGNRVWEEQSPTLRANMGDNQPAVCYDGVIPINTMTCQGRPSDNGRMGLGVGELDDPANTISAAHCHAVCFDRATFNQGINAQYDFEVSQEGVVSTVVAKGPSGVCYDARGNGDGETVSTLTGDHQNRITDYTAVAVQEAKPPRRYIIRRLLPVECARLQGFPDTWGHLAPYNPADAEFWEDVRKTHAEINGKKYKPVKDIRKWYEKLHTDSAEYKMWGNGIALPCAEYVLHNLAEHGATTLGSLFDGSGGFPLAGIMNGITTRWTSEIEPYPIAVTKSRFE